MGKRFAPAYANIYMAEWEEGIFEKCQQQPLIYLRYLDDIWGIWSHSKTDFDDFVETMNQHHTSIKVEATLKDKEELPLVVTYSTFGTRATRTLRENFKRILKNTTLDNFSRVIPAYRGNPNLKKLLDHGIEHFQGTHWNMIPLQTKEGEISEMETLGLNFDPQGLKRRDSSPHRHELDHRETSGGRLLMRSGTQRAQPGTAPAYRDRSPRATRPLVAAPANRPGTQCSYECQFLVLPDLPPPSLDAALLNLREGSRGATRKGDLREREEFKQHKHSSMPWITAGSAFPTSGVVLMTSLRFQTEQSQEQEVGSREQGVGSREQGVGSRE
ncbi:hypothetical protein D4764_03G0012110 [Takifugu flavidus]|uniref:Reverse transcriptase domain-containing protein n=1 Tax=Takifugu flavidus TaxID=433684 RepID=A0A5C6NAR3_9TELE|nr:hypothetical protein D4764_03G0012110 [Takifugu flavidus]